VPTTTQAYYVSGDGTSSLRFRYVVQAGQSSADLTNGTPLVCGGTACPWLTSDQGAPASALSTTLLSASKAIIIDAIAPSAPTSPTVTIAGGKIVPGYVNSTNTGVTISATIAAAQVGTTGTAQMLVGGSVVATTTAGTPSNTATTASVTLSGGIQTAIPTGSQTLAIRLRDSVLVANNGPNAGSASANVTVIADYAQPNVTGTSTSQGSGTVLAGTSIPFTVTFNEPVTAGPQNLTTNISGRTATCSAASGSTTLSCAYYVAPGDTTSGGALAVNLGTLSGVTDVAGNAMFVYVGNPFSEVTVVVNGT
jgi:hypothetical protein